MVVVSQGRCDLRLIVVNQITDWEFYLQLKQVGMIVLVALSSPVYGKISLTSSSVSSSVSRLRTRKLRLGCSVWQR
ncbi:hypothetical protein NDI48_25420 [Microcoleus sp. AS-A8]